MCTFTPDHLVAKTVQSVVLQISLSFCSSKGLRYIDPRILNLGKGGDRLLQRHQLFFLFSCLANFGLLSVSASSAERQQHPIARLITYVYVPSTLTPGWWLLLCPPTPTY
ncbi:hypothetical protein F5Y15DRAFT_375377 [Xylariaceae sp. FL0016]|nr:hypothetical protein F5Y15DRAFT_375377 [Xylariaceae sp. FL0016]